MAKNRIYKRAGQALRRIDEIERLNEIIYNNAVGDADNTIVSRIYHNIGLLRGDLETLRNRNRI